MNAGAGTLSFAQLCYEHTYAGCGCGMCKEGDVCPTPILKLAESVHDDGLVPAHNPGLIDTSLLQDAR